MKTSPRPQEKESIRTGTSPEILYQALLDNLYYVQGRPPEQATRNDWYMALAYTVRDRLLGKWVQTLKHLNEDVKVVSYLSAEFLLGPQLGNNLINLGIWEGMTREEIMERHPEDYAARLQDLVHRRVDGGESFNDVRERVMRKLTRVLAEHAGGTIVLLAHGGVNRVILFDALNLDLAHLMRMDQSYGCINIIDYYEGGPVVKLVNG